VLDVEPADAGQLVEDLRAEVAPGDALGLALAGGVGLGLASGGAPRAVGCSSPHDLVALIDRELRPRWVWWSIATASALVRAGVRPGTCWDVAAVHRMLFGGWRAEPARAWAALHDLPVDEVPVLRPVDLFTSAPTDEELDDPVLPGGHLRPEWQEATWGWTPARLARWAELARAAGELQRARLATLRSHPVAGAVARAESAAELLCAELMHDGLPVRREVAESIVRDLVGERPRTDAEAAQQRAARDAAVLRHAPVRSPTDLRNPAHVRRLLRTIGVELPDTRAWRLDALRGTHPLVDALLEWRRAERVATTFGYGWLDEHLGRDGRLRGTWSGADGAAGRMTASAGLHNMPAVLRPAVVAEPGHRFVRADLGQVEPRVLAVVASDRALARATGADDLYATVAGELDVDRATAKVAVLGAMYGATTGQGGVALARLERAYPVAMAFLEQADVAGQVGRDLRTWGGRLVRFGGGGGGGDPDGDGEADDGGPQARGRAAARGRYARNAMVQGAAAELFKVWAVTTRSRAARLGASIVLCLHDELLVHVPADRAEDTADLLVACLHEAAGRWAPGSDVRFVADVSIVDRWSDATA